MRAFPKFPGLLLTMAAVLLSAGCTLIPKFERPPATVAPRFPGATNDSPATELTWREFFQDAPLVELIQLALTNNLDLRVAILNVEQSRAQYRISRSALMPTVNANGSFLRAHAADVTADAWVASIGTTSYELDLFGRIRSMNQQALEQYLATEQAMRSAQISLVSEVASQYYTLRQAQSQLDLARQTLDTVRESRSLISATFEAGQTSELDLRTAEGQVQTAQINVLTYERRIAQTKNSLTLLVGRTLPETMPDPRPFEDPDLLPQVPAGLPSELIQRRPDILEAEHTLRAANANIGVARAAFFPSIKLSSSVGTTSAQFEQLFASSTGLWSFSPQVTLPLFTGGQNRADLDAARVGKSIEVSQYQKSIQTAFREVADALVVTQTYANQMVMQAALTTAQQRRFDLASARYLQGDTAYLDVLSAQQDLYAAQQGQLEARLAWLLGDISLFRALGGGWK